MTVNTNPMRQFPHAILPQATSDEAARQEFVRSFKLHLAQRISPGNRITYERDALPRFKKEKGREPQSRFDVREVMEQEPFYRFWSTLQRTSQEMMWNSCRVSIQRQLDDLINIGQTVGNPKSGTALGSLTLNPDLPIPAYHRAVDIHCQPGGYHTEFTENDVTAGAIYDRAVHIYAMGRMGPFNNDIGASLVNWIQRKHPDFSPKTILDMGCTVGHSTIPYVDAFPDAEVYAIDVGAPVLRYAHARAESLGKKVHFSQQNAEKTNFADESFDLIVSHILVHETSHKAMRNIMREAHRLLRPGGMVIHVETPPYASLDSFDAFMLDWDTRNNNEPYWGASHEIDPKAIAAETGFKAENAFADLAPSAFEEGEKARTKVFQGGDFGGGGAWYLFGAKK